MNQYNLSVMTRENLEKIQVKPYDKVISITEIIQIPEVISM